MIEPFVILTPDDLEMYGRSHDWSPSSHDGVAVYFGIALDMVHGLRLLFYGPQTLVRDTTC